MHELRRKSEMARKSPVVAETKKQEKRIAKGAGPKGHVRQVMGAVVDVHDQIDVNRIDSSTRPYVAARSDARNGQHDRAELVWRQDGAVGKSVE